MHDEATGSGDGRIAAVAADPRYTALVRDRARYGWRLTGLVLAAYFGFILLVAFDKPLLARSFAGGATSLGIPIGMAVIFLAILLTGLYVRRANRDYDARLAALLADHGA